ncbi:MAG: hypothetical protein HOL58_04850 [Francisellaceae bacterium]|nr:hypothetical protein [Francisellaceae bacterium]
MINIPLNNRENNSHNLEERAGSMLVRLSKILLSLELPARVKLLEKIRKTFFNDQNSLTILKFLCYSSNINHSTLLSIASKEICPNNNISLPKLLCHMLCMWGSSLSDSYMSNVLELDISEVRQLIEHLKQTFTIDDPIRWLQSLAKKYEKQRLESLKNKENLMHGWEMTTQAIDTREERRVKNRRLKNLSPHPDGF